MPAQIVRERSKLTTSGVRTLNIYWTVRSRRTVLAIKIVRKSLKKIQEETLRRTQIMKLREGWRWCSCHGTEIQGKMKQVARTLVREHALTWFWCDGDAAAGTPPSQQGPLRVFETREKRRPAILEERGWLLEQSGLESHRRQPKVGYSVVIVPSFYYLLREGLQTIILSWWQQDSLILGPIEMNTPTSFIPFNILMITGSHPCILR